MQSLTQIQIPAFLIKMFLGFASQSTLHCFPSWHPSFPCWLRSSHLHHTFTGRGLWPPNFFSRLHFCFSESYTRIALRRSVCDSHLVISLVVGPEKMVSYCHQRWKGGRGSFESLGGTRNYSLYWAIHSHCRIASIPGHRLLNAMKTPSHCDNQEIHIHILRRAQVLLQLTSKRKVCVS